MITIRFDKEELDSLLESEFREAPEAERDKLRPVYSRAFWDALLVGMENPPQGMGMNLSAIYSFGKIKDLLRSREKHSLEEISVDPEDFTILINFFRAYQGWNANLAPVIMLVDKKLTALQEEQKNASKV